MNDQPERKEDLLSEKPHPVDDIATEEKETAAPDNEEGAETVTTKGKKAVAKIKTPG